MLIEIRKDVWLEVSFYLRRREDKNDLKYPFDYFISCQICFWSDFDVPDFAFTNLDLGKITSSFYCVMKIRSSLLIFRVFMLFFESFLSKLCEKWAKLLLLRISFRSLHLVIAIWIQRLINLRRWDLPFWHQTWRWRLRVNDWLI